MSDKDIEQAIQAKGLTAPRVTPQHIESLIRSEVYFTGTDGANSPGARVKSEYVEGERILAPLDLLTFCVLVLRNGFTVTGESACASPENFDQEIGRKIARENAVNKIWMLEGYLLKQRLHDSFEIAAQQKDSRLQAAVNDRGMITGEAFTINDMGTIEMTQITTRFGDTVWDLPDAGTRNALMADYAVFVPVEKRDLRKLLADPQGPYLQLTLAASNRKKDDVVYRALLDPVMRKTSSGGAYAPVALPASQKIVAGGTGMFLVHQSVKPHRLQRRGQTEWVLEPAPFIVEPFDEVRDTPQKWCKPSVKEFVGSEITLTLSDADPGTNPTPPFTGGGWVAQDVGSYVRLNGGLVLIKSITSAQVAVGTIRSDLTATQAASPGSWRPKPQSSRRRI